MNEENRPRRRHRWGRFLLIWALILLLLGAGICFVLYRYLGIYEVTRPEAVLESFLAEHSPEDLLQAGRENLQLDLSEYENAGQLYDAYVKSIDLSHSLAYRPDSARSTEDTLVYVVRSGVSNICSVTLTPRGTSPGFGRHYWIVSEVSSAPITDQLHSVTLVIDALASEEVFLNGKRLTTDYIVESGLSIPDLTSVERRMNPEPAFVQYKVGPVYGEVLVADAEGRALSPEGDPASGILRYTASHGDRSVSIEAPESVTVFLNGVPLAASDAVSSSLGVLSGLTAYTGEYPEMTVTYHFEGLYVFPEVTAQDVSGLALTPYCSSEGTYVFFHETDARDAEALREIAENYFRSYIRYTSTRYDASLYTNLIRQVLYGTDLYVYLSTTMDTMYWAGWSQDAEMALNFSNIHTIGDNCFLCTVSYSVDRTSTYWYEEVSAVQSGTYELVFVYTAGAWYAAAMNLINAE